MNREKSLAKNTIILSIGTFLPKLAAMITLPLLTGYLTAAEYGTYDLVTTLVSLLLPAVTLQIQSAAFRFLINTRENLKESQIIITNILLFTVSISFISVVILAFSIRSLEVGIRWAIALYFFSDILLVTFRQITRGLGDNLGYSIDSITNSVVMLFLTALNLCVLKNGLLGVLIALTGSTFWSLFFLTLRIKIWKYISAGVFSFKEIKRLLAYSWPMVPNNLSGWVLSLSDRFVITYFIGIEANAVYAVANKIPNLLKTFQSTFTFAWQENASLSVEDKDSKEYYSKMFEEITYILVGAMACLIAGTPVLFKILIHGNYSEAYFQMAILYLAAYFSVLSGVLGGIYIAHMKTKNVGITTMLAAGINLIVDLFLVKKIGIFAGSISTLVSYLFLLIYRMVNVRRFQPMKYNYLNMIFGTLWLIIMSVLSYCRMLTLDVVNVILAVIIVFVFDRKIIVSMFSIILRKIRRTIYRK